MKVLILFFLVTMTNSVTADQLSIQSGSLVNNIDTYYVTYDYKVQYEHGDNRYGFIQYRNIGTCPSYCEYNAIGLGARHDFGWVLWWDPRRRHLISFNAGVYYQW